jgi:hypothetical protein
VRTERLNVLLCVDSWTFCRVVWGVRSNWTDYCVTWLLYNGRPGQTSEKRLLWLWRKTAMLLDWGSGTLDITLLLLLVFHFSCGFLGIALCWCWQCLLTVGGNLLPRIVTPLDVITVAWCFRQTQDILDSTECQEQNCKHHSDSGQQASSLTVIARDVPAICVLKIGVLSRWRLCRAITRDHWFPHCAVAELWFYTNCVSFCATEMLKRMQNVLLRILYRETARVYPAINWFIRSIRREFRKTWNLIINFLNSNVPSYFMLVGQVLLICVSDDNLHQFTYVKWRVSLCFISQRFLIQVFLRDLANFTLFIQIKSQRLPLVNC